MAAPLRADRGEAARHPDRRPGRPDPRRPRPAPDGADEARRRRPRLERPRHDQPGEGAHRLRPRQRASRSSRRGAVDPAPRRRRPGARLRLPRLLGAQGLRPDGNRRPLRQGVVALEDAALPGGRRHDRVRVVREDDLRRAPGEVRGGHGKPRGCRRSRRGARLRDGARDCRGSPRTRRTSSPTPRRASPRFPASGSSAPPGRRRASSPSSSATSTRTTSGRSSTRKGSASGPATTARSRS